MTLTPISNFGWTYLSREALRQAEAQLTGEVPGVRDEIGFLIIHQRYADRFFPGTSVLHTRLRYALFVPWIYDDLHRKPLRGRVQDALKNAELALVKQLLKAGEGVIGIRSWPKATSQPPSIAYWTALGEWGILRPTSEGRLPSRAAVHGMLRKPRRASLDDDQQPLTASELPFIALPPRPAEWDSGKSLTFELTRKEATFLSGQLANVMSPVSPGQKSVLARLAVEGPVQADNCWSPSVRALADQDAAALRRAGDAASLAAIGRAVYAALVETLKDEQDKAATLHIHRQHLPGIIDEHAEAAGRVDLGLLCADTDGLPATLTDVLRDTLDWLRRGRKNPMPLLDIYAAAECERKTQRARLAQTINGRQRRMEWRSEHHALAAPLHYRWDRVYRLLQDLWAAR